MGEKTIKEEELNLVNELLKKTPHAIHAVFDLHIMSVSEGGWGPVKHKEIMLSETSADVHATISAETRLGQGDFDVVVNFTPSDDGEWVARSIRVEGSLPEYNQIYPVE